ncbi:hypothetical protein RB614_13290 [Phytohabitans sp. ZYX-F-186]|uniref:Lipoprotein n=1 Tax=Phytohabitans maris TaxID=3071409 RepID=A0ABU0ZEV3_9ACTN|nr:hypothetical protein [Phytohabitans sp. ZYX-F-186]MDQ7905498.1 hypothetical protein [Phytohabitans sp. ZYX-F-186]
MRNRTAMLVLAGAVVFASSIGAVAGCLSLGDDGGLGGGGIGAGSTPSPSADAGLGTLEATVSPSPATTYETPRNTETTRTTTTTTTRPPQDTGARIVWFRITQEPQCPQGTTEYPVEGVPVVVEWKVTGADKVTISVDGPGIYGTYPTEGSETFTFSCGGAADGETVKHTYLLKTVGGGSTKSKQLTATATAHEITEV